MQAFNLLIIGFAVYAAARAAYWANEGVYGAAFVWFTLALMGIPALLMDPTFKP